MNRTTVSPLHFNLLSSLESVWLSQNIVFNEADMVLLPYCTIRLHMAITSSVIQFCIVDYYGNAM